MYLPDGISEAAFLRIVEDIVKRIPGKFICGSLQRADVQQEVRLACINGVKKFDPALSTNKLGSLESSLERFLRVHVSNRLKNLKRDHVGKPNQPRSNLIYATNLSNISDEVIAEESQIEANAHYNHLQDLIQECLPTALRSDFLRMCANVKIPRPRQLKVQAEILKIVGEISSEEY